MLLTKIVSNGWVLVNLCEIKAAELEHYQFVILSGAVSSRSTVRVGEDLKIRKQSFEDSRV